MSIDATGYQILVETCANLQPHETALIISDETTRSLGEHLHLAALQVSPHSQHHTIPSLGIHGQEPPPEVAAIMRKSNVIFSIVEMSLAHSKARFEASQNGSRFLSLPNYSMAVIEGSALRANFKEITPLSLKLAEKFTMGSELTVTSSAGTNFSSSLVGRRGNAAPGWCYAEGTIASPPDAESNVAVVEASSEGTIVVDGSVPHPKLGLLKAPVTLCIQQGKVTSITGESASLLESIFEEAKNPRARIVAEFGVGLNPLAQLCGSMLEDEGALGTVHFGIGSNATIGGENAVAFHLDHVIKAPNVFIDGECILRDGKILL